MPLRASDDRARRRRNSLAIAGYTGANGGGKTLCAVYDALSFLAVGRPIVSTCRILDPFTGEPHPLWVPLDDFRLLLELRKCVVILDEVTGVASSRDSAGLPSAVLNHLMQLRKDDVILKWTTPNWKRADTGIREVTQGLTVCRGFAPETKKTIDPEDGLPREWRPRRGFSWKTYDARNFDEWSMAKERSSSKQHRLRPLARQIQWGPGLAAREFYDTYEHALTLGVVSERGLCMDCGGSKPAKRCACAGEVVHDPSPGMILWREIEADRRARYAVDLPVDGLELSPAAEDSPAGPILLPETDDTPAVLVDAGFN